VRAAVRDGRDTDVPCGDCCACCDSGHFVHIGPAETDTLAHVPPELLFPAPGYPAGTVLMGYDGRGHCPMLSGGLCSIYEHRPLTCRVYDCRVFAAAEIDADRDAITRRARRWAFAYPTQGDRDDHEAVRAAARFVRDHRELLPPAAVPRDPPHLAVLAVMVSDGFPPAADELAGERLARHVLDVARRLMPGTVPPDTC